MKNFTPLFLLTVALFFFTLGCESLFVNRSSPTSFPVMMGAATTNDVNLAAWLAVAKSANQNFNPTPTQVPINALITALVGLTSAVSGFLVHKHGVKRSKDKNTFTDAS